MTDALDAMKAAFDAIGTAPASTFTSFRGYRRTAATGSGKTTSRFIFFRIGGGAFGARGAGNAAGRTEGDIIVVATAPCDASPSDAEQDLVYDVVRQFDTALTGAATSRVLTSGGRTYQVMPEVEHEDLLVTTALPWAVGKDHFILRARFGVRYAGV